jgi:diphthamide synthase (EF-2-diphthine--ammonia ligase)
VCKNLKAKAYTYLWHRIKQASLERCTTGQKLSCNHSKQIELKCYTVCEVVNNQQQGAQSMLNI